MKTLNDLLKLKPVLFDGAMGTAIQKLKYQDADPPELLNLNYPEKLEEIHRSYIEAGSMVIETNTFGGSRPRLEVAGLGDKLKEINQAAVKAARNAAGEEIFVAGSVGPSGLLLEPFGEAPRENVLNYFEEQINILIDSGADIILIETMLSLDEALTALEAAKNCNSKITGVTMTFDHGQQGIRTSFGESPETVVNKLKESGADFVGSNCGHGLNDMILIAKEMRGASDIPVLIQPNAGIPEYTDGQIVYNETPDKFAEFVKAALQINIDFVGGCCGTTFEHIKQGAEAIRNR